MIGNKVSEPHLGLALGPRVVGRAVARGGGLGGRGADGDGRQGRGPGLVAEGRPEGLYTLYYMLYKYTIYSIYLRYIF